MKTLKLCSKCQQLLSEAYDLKPDCDALEAYSKIDVKKCENCKKARPDLKVFMVGKKGG